MNSDMVHGRHQTQSPVERNSSSRSTGSPAWRKVDLYFAAWAIVLPVSSVLIVPFIQGTTPAYLFALSLLLPPVTFFVMRLDEGVAFYRHLLFLTFCFIAFTAAAQFALAGSGIRHLTGIMLVDPYDRDIVLRRTLITQSVYLLAAACTYVFVRMFYRPSWDRYFLAGASFLAVFGLYELVFFAVTGQSGDFLSNRLFGGGHHTGSWFQTISIGSVSMQRLKSLTGEPSMYAFTILPFWIYCIHTRRFMLQSLLFVTLLLTTSTTAFFGIALYFLFRLIRFGPTDRLTLLAIAIACAVAFLIISGNEFLSDAYKNIIAEKLESHSGIERYSSFEAGIRFFAGAPLLNQLFGLGFGYVRSTDMLSTLLINTGVIGFCVTAFIFFKPVFSLARGYYQDGLRAGLIVVFATMMTSVPEFSYLSLWLFLGLAYHHLDVQRRTAIVPAGARTRANYASAQY